MSAILIDAVVKSFANAGKTYGKTQTVLCNAFKLARENAVDATAIEDYKYTFYLNAVRSALSLTEARACDVVRGSKDGGLSPFDFKAPEKMGDKNRTPDEQRVFDGVKSAFSTARKASGFPMKAITPRPPRATVAPSVVSPERAVALVALDEAVIESVDEKGLLQTFAAAYRLLSRSLNAGGALVVGDVGSILRGAITDMHAALAEAGYNFDTPSETE